MSLYSKYRPTTFAEMKGNFSALEEHFKIPSHNHALLFTGGVGCGKTTAGRIIASMIGADDIDLQEVNVGDKTGIDDMRKIIDSISTSSWGKAKVYLLDEFHKASDQAQTAMFKSLEDVPEHVYFILCSSEPNKIKAAIRSRATTFNFPPLTPDMLYAIMRDVKNKEGFTISKDILFDIAENVEGSARKALTVLEAIATLSAEEQKVEVANQLVSVNNAEVIELCRLIFNSKTSWGQLRAVLKSLKDQGLEAEGLRRAVLGYGQALLLNQDSDDTTAFIMEKLVDNVYDSGFPGLVTRCYLSRTASARGF
jgi:DNA polymerase III gamma/tau subunit